MKPLRSTRLPDSALVVAAGAATMVTVLTAAGCGRTADSAGVPVPRQ